MAETAPATTSIPAAPAAIAPTLGSAAPLTQTAAAEKARAAAKTGELAPGAPPAAPAPAATPPGIQTEGANLNDLTRLSSENRALQQKVKQLEPAAKDAALLKEVRDLYASGKKMAAIGKLAGADPSAEMEALIVDYIKDPNDATVQDKLAKKVDEVAGRIDAAAAASQAAAVDTENARAATGYVIAQIKAGATKLPHLSAADGNEATGKVLSAVTRLRYERGFDDHTKMTAEDTQSVLADALYEVDIEYEVRAAKAARAAAQVGGAPPKPPAPVAPAAAAATPPPAEAEEGPEIDSLSRPGLTVQPWGKTLTHAQAREKLKEKLRQGLA